MIIEKDFTFDSAHFLPYVPEGHKCRRIHGHTYRLTLGLNGALQQPQGWVEDFGDVKKQAAPLIEELDHKLLNAIPGLENPTAEEIARFIYHRLKPTIPQLAYVKLDETPTSRAIYHGESQNG